MRFVVSFHTGNPDKTYYLQPPALWSAGELASAILCGCMPATAAFVNHVSPKLARTWSLYLRPSPDGTPRAGGAPRAPLPRSSWRAPRAWNESYLLRSGSDGEGEVGMRQLLLHKPLILIPPIGPLVQLPERRNISPTSSPVAQNSVDVAPSATESVPGMRPLDAGSRQRCVTCDVDDADTVLGTARGGRGPEDREQCFGKQEGGKVIGLPLSFEAVGRELEGDCHNLH
ncbi:hypothetical protein HO133_006520 [Letharia lupina]|uniref:Uncharacterized protein n=1 Tax=Letharia lupina TaxID=560253 RepID=A0A8H6C602_9LECA|nr:uncharacterized protein HO133_006520 [Letharia lupina]KAF6217693.1 hypothetical protein HO133_006520 [Letharia lupina]